MQEVAEEKEFESLLKNKLQDRKGVPEPKGKLKTGVSETFNSIFECARKCGGMDMQFFRRLTANSNESAHLKIYRGKINGYNFKPITVTEMINFFGIMLKISVYNNNLGGYDSYWKDNVCIQAGLDYNINLSNHYPWSKEVMSIVRFKQIRSVFRPESGRTIVGDKCHQLRWYINKLYATARNAFIPGYKLSFNEGGHATR
jgi:hypothetical protein